MVLLTFKQYNDHIKLYQLKISKYIEFDQTRLTVKFQSNLSGIKQALCSYYKFCSVFQKLYLNFEHFLLGNTF